jgi:hypothetical protein
MATPKQQNSYPLRMPDELRTRLEAAAKAEGRSVNALIVSLLQDALDHPPGDIGVYSSGALLEEVVKRYGNVMRIEIGKDIK